MAKPSIELVQALRETARRLQNGAHYVWGHHGACNCGNLLQVITSLDEKEILIHDMKRELSHHMEKNHVQSIRMKEYEEQIQRWDRDKNEVMNELHTLQHELVNKNTVLSSVMNEANEYHLKKIHSN